MEEIFRLLAELAKQRFYGSVTVKFQGGKIVLLRKEETFLPSTPTQKERNHSESKQF